MSDRKFERKYDRQIIQLDHKQRILDLMDFQAAPPEVGIYDEPVRYFKANLEWCKFIFGLLAWAEHIAYWKDAEDELHHAIQQILIFEEGIEGGILMSPDEFKQSLYEGLYKWTNDVAKQIVSGGIGGFSVDEDGNVTVGGAGGDSEIPDDPETPHDEGAESKTGSAIKLANEINRFYSTLSGLFGVDIVPDRPASEAIEYVENVWMRGESSTAITDAINEFWTRRAAGDPVVDFIEGLAEWLYCEGMTLDAVRELIYLQESDSDSADNGVDLLGVFDSDWLNLWIMQGSELPSTAYLAYGCVPVPVEEFDIDMSTGNFVSRPTTNAYKHGHRILVEPSQKFTDSDNPGEERDWFYHKNAAGAVTFEAPSFVKLGLFPAGAFTATKVPYQASGVYRVTVDLVGDDSSDDGQIVIGKDNGSFNLPNTTGLLHMKITDLGAY